MMNIKSVSRLFQVVFIMGIWAFGINISRADSDLFPPQQNAPALTSYVSGGTFKHTYYISPNGDDTNGDGSITKPWLSVLGASTGGSGIPVSAGDLIYMRGGVYPTHSNVSWKRGYYNLQRDGTASDYIVFTKYPGETPQFTGSEGIFSFTINKSSYIVLDGLTFINGGNVEFQISNHVVIQNSTFAVCSDGWGDQNQATCIGLGDNIDSVVIRNNYFGPSTSSHAIKMYTSNSIVTNVKVLYNRFNGITPSYGVIGHKGPEQNWEYAYNRFQNCSKAIRYGLVYSYPTTDRGDIIHHNVFDNVGTIIERGSAGTKDVANLLVYDNVVINATKVLSLKCDAGVCMNNGTLPMGEFYNNVLFGISDAIDPWTTTNFVNYPNYWNYNAYQSASARDSAENKKNLGSASWQGNAVITTDTIHTTGNTGDRFYYISDTSPLRNKGRNGDTIGGFTWGNGPILPMPPAVQ